MFDLVCVGETFEDLIFHDLPGWPRLGDELQTSSLTRTWGGGALLTAVAASRQGIRTQVVSALPAGARARLRAERVAVRDLRRPEEAHAVTVALSNENDRAFVTYTGSNPELEIRLLAILPRLRARHLHLALEPHDCMAWTEAVEQLRARRVGTSFDFGCHPALRAREGFAELCSAPDYLLLNAREAQLYSEGAARARCLVIKLGAHGCEARRDALRWRATGIEVAAVETTGAGDAFNGGFLAALLKGLDMQASLELGNRVGAASTLRPGGL